MPMSAPVALHVNGGGITVQVDASETPLLHVLRENLGLPRPENRFFAARY